MSRIQPIEHSTATGATKQMMDSIQANFGMIPNLMGTFANSPATLGFFLQGSTELAKSTLGAKLREQIDLAVSEANGCNYCLAAHSAIGKNLKLTDAQILDARQGKSTEARTDAALKFALAINNKRGHVTSEDLAAVRGAGFTEAEVADIIAATALKIFSNYFAIASEVEIDFPKVQPVSATATAT